MPVTSQCAGFTRRGVPCRNSVADGAGWCGRCAGVPAPPGPKVAAAAASDFAAGVDPFAADPPRWGTELDVDQIARVAASRNADPEILAAIHQTWSGVSFDIDYALARNPRTPTEAVDALAGHHADRVAMEARRNPSLSPAARRSLAANAPYDLAANPAATAEDLAEAARRHSAAPNHLSAVARHPNLDHGHMAVFAADDTWQIRYAVAANPRCDPEILAALAADESDVVAGQAASHPHLPLASLEAAAASTDERVAAGAAANPAAPPALLAKIVAGNKRAKVLAAAAANNNCPTGALNTLATDTRNTVRFAAAKNTATSPDALVVLSASPESKVRRAVARHRHTPPAALARLAADPHPKVRAEAARNPRTPAAGKAAAGLLSD